MYYNRAGEMIGRDEYYNLVSTPDYKRVAKTELPDDQGIVSTVWLGIDHSFGYGPLLIFETLVFGGPLDKEMDRYTTEQEALTGHEQMVARVKACKE